MDSPNPVDQFSEVLVAGQKQGRVGVGEIEYFIIRDTWRHLCYIKHIVAVAAESLDDLSLHALVSENLHTDCNASG
jgi:hypothetical protein